MLDWPEATQTSPNITSFVTTVFFPRTVRVNGPPACMGRSATFHRRSSPATVSAICPARLTVIFSAESAQPQIGTATSLCKTICSLNRCGRTGSAHSDGAHRPAILSRYTVADLPMYHLHFTLPKALLLIRLV